MRIGDLKKRISFQSPTRTSDGMGGFLTTWKNEATVFSAIWPISANEQIQAMQTAMIITHRIRIRYRSDIVSSWRILYGSRYFSIISIINPNEQDRMLDLLCKEAA